MRLWMAIFFLGCGCDIDDDTCSNDVEPIAGTQDDFSWTETQPEGLTLTGPRACPEATVETHVFEVAIEGLQPVDETWLTDELRPTLTEAGISTGFGVSSCPDGSAVSLIVRSWNDADELVGMTWALARDHNVDVEIAVSVEAFAVPCAE